ncbi:MAG: chorismate synthase [Spirochaetes bacterium]|nr:chorismate synthase [Spirochaetota bacterium]
MNTFGRFFRVTTWGESHGRAIGAVIDGCPPGIKLSEEDIQSELKLRSPGQTDLTSPRNEKDEVEIVSGVFEGRTTGTPVSLIIYNKDTKSVDYNDLKDIPRPGQADFAYLEKYGIRDHRGGGRASGRETASRVAAGAVAKKILESEGIAAVGFSLQIGAIRMKTDRIIPEHNIPVNDAVKLRQRVYRSPVRCPDDEVSREMEDAVRQISEEEDSLGGIVEVRAYGVPPGLGDPVFGKIDAVLAYAIVSVGAVKGVEIGDGFGLSLKKGSESNDRFVYENGKLKPGTNSAGGILGGISTGMPVIVRAAVKPTPSIRKKQRTADIKGNPVMLSIKGRHDPCIVVRMVPVLENMVNLVLIDLLLSQRTLKGVRHG